MYESKIDDFEKNSGPACSSIESRPAEWPDAQRPVAAISSHDAQWLANSAQSATGERKCKDCPKVNVERVCAKGCGYSYQKEKPCLQERLASMGDTSTERRQSVYPESQTELVVSKKPDGKVNADNVLRLLEYQQYHCALSGRKLTPQIAALDHIVPIRYDGEHTIENTQVLHKDVNRAKGSLTNSEFIQLCHEVVLRHKISTPEKEVK